MSEMTTSGPFADALGFTGYEPNLTNNQNLVTWQENPHPSWLGNGQITSNPQWRSVQNFTEVANAHNDRNLLAEQQVCWREQGGSALNFQQVGSARAAQE